VEWSRDNSAYIHEIFSNVVLYADVGVIRVCTVGATSSMCVVLSENWVFQFSFDL
jgi:hypothetical protein